MDPLEGIVPIDCKWVFKKKIGSNRKVETCKARLVAKGYCQSQGINYEVTFSLVIMLKSIRILLAIIAYYDCEIFQLDVKITFLKGYIDQDIYIERPRGFTPKDQAGKVCKFKRSMYVLSKHQ